MNKILIALTLILFPVTAFCDVLRDEIVARDAEFAAAINSGDIDTVVGLYAEGFSVIPNGGEPVTDPETLSAMLADLAAASSDLEFETISVDDMGEYAYEFGKSHYTVTSDNGEQTPAGETYVVIWRKGEDGNWYLLVDAFWSGAGSQAD